MGFIKINDKLKKRGQKTVRFIPQAAEGARIKALIGGCDHCIKMRDNMIQAVKNLNIPEADFEIITDIAEIARMGVLATPSVIIDGKLVVSGKLLPVEEIETLIKETFAEKDKTEE